MSNRSEVHTLGAFVHGALAALHALGIVYGLRRKNYGDAVIHAGAFIFSARATAHHARHSDLSTRNGIHHIEPV
jgi:hypothetical protein